MNSKITSIHQPSYFPWQGMLNKINSSDLFIVMDDVQLSSGGFQNRNQFLDKASEIKYLTIPIYSKHHTKHTIKEMQISDGRWQKKHKRFLEQNYNKHPFFDEIFPLILPLYTKEYTFLVDVLLDSMQILNQAFEIQTKIVLQSTLEYDRETYKESLVFALLHATDSKHYLSGNGASVYQTQEHFAQEHIALQYTEYKQTPYKQFQNEEFVPGLSSLDLLFNVGSQEAKKYI